MDEASHAPGPVERPLAGWLRAEPALVMAPFRQQTTRSLRFLGGTDARIIDADDVLQTVFVLALFRCESGYAPMPISLERARASFGAFLRNHLSNVRHTAQRRAEIWSTISRSVAARSSPLSRDLA